MDFFLVKLIENEHLFDRAVSKLDKSICPHHPHNTLIFRSYFIFYNINNIYDKNIILTSIIVKISILLLCAYVFIYIIHNILGDVKSHKFKLLIYSNNNNNQYLL